MFSLAIVFVLVGVVSTGSIAFFTHPEHTLIIKTDNMVVVVFISLLSTCLTKLILNNFRSYDVHHTLSNQKGRNLRGVRPFDLTKKLHVFVNYLRLL